MNGQDSSDNIVLSLTRTGTVTYLNEWGHRLLGYKPGELIGENWFHRCVPETDRPALERMLEERSTVSAPESTVYEHPLLARDGGTRVVRWTSIAAARSGAAPGTLLCSGREITEQKLAEDRLRHRLRYEEAMTVASGILVQRESDLSRALEAIRSSTGSCRAYVFENTRTPEGDLAAHYAAEACAPDAEPQIDNPRLHELTYNEIDPGFRKALQAGETVDRHTETLPPQNQEILLEQDIVQVLLIPIFGEGEWLGFLGFDECRETRQWQQEDVQFLRSFADMIGNFLIRRRSQERLESHLRFQRLVAEVSGEFARSMGRDMDGAISGLLGRMGEFFDSDRAYLLRIDHDRETLSNSHEWCAPGASSEKERLQDMPLTQVDHLVAPLLRGELLHVPNVSALPAEAAAERSHLESQGIRSLLNIPLRAQERTIGIFGFDSIRELRSWSAEEIRLMAVVADILAGALENQDTLGRLARERRLMNMLLQASPDYIFFKDSTGHYSNISDSMAELLGLEGPEQARGKRSADFYDVDLAEQLEREEAEMQRSGEPLVGAERQVRWPNGRRSWVSLSKAPMFDHQGRFVGTFAIARDITRNKESEQEIARLLEEKDMLLREVHHRIKNNMNSVESLLSLQGSMLQSTEARQALEEARNRLQSMEVLYEKLYRSGNVTRMSAAEYLRSLAEEIIRVYSGDTALEFLPDLDDITMEVRVLSSLGMIVNELVTNSLKHAFADRKHGSISLTLSRESGEELRLRYSDDGVGIPEDILDGESHGLGMVLLQSLSDQLEGTLSMENAKGGVVTLRFSYPDEDGGTSSSG